MRALQHLFTLLPLSLTTTNKMEALQAVNLSLVASYGVPLVLAPRSMQKQLYPKQTPSEASVLATRNNGVALCQARPLSLAPRCSYASCRSPASTPH